MSTAGDAPDGDPPDLAPAAPLPSRRAALRRALLALGAPLSIAALLALLLLLTRGSPYRGRLAAMTGGIGLERRGQRVEPKALQVLELETGDRIRAGSGALTRLDLDSGAVLEIWGGAKGSGALVAIGQGPAELEALELGYGRIVLRAPRGAPLRIRNGQSWVDLEGGEADVDASGVEARHAGIKVSFGGATPQELSQGERLPWPPP